MVGVNDTSPRKPGRPRDALGRPLAWGDANALEMEDFDALSTEANHLLGIQHFESGRYFPAHEAWETCWKQTKGTEDAEFFKGLAQLGAGYVHLLRGNAHGAVTLLTRAQGRLRTFPPGHRGIDTLGVVARCSKDRRGVETGALQPGPEALTEDPPRLRALQG
jgi:uncharacterized protein